MRVGSVWGEEIERCFPAKGVWWCRGYLLREWNSCSWYSVLCKLFKVNYLSKYLRNDSKSRNGDDEVGWGWDLRSGLTRRQVFTHF